MNQIDRHRGAEAAVTDVGVEVLRFRDARHFNRRCRDVPCLGAITVEEVVAATVRSFDSV